MTNTEFVKKLIDIALNYKTVYMWGVWGSPVTESIITRKITEYPDWYTSTRQKLFRSLIGKGYFAFDCVCLIKGVLWGWSGNPSKIYGGAGYEVNGVPDVTANGMFSKCSNRSSNFSNVEVGEAVWTDGHIGVYIGNGKAIECTPKWDNGVQITAVGNIGTISGFNTRKWTQHGKLPYINYTVKQPVEVIKEDKPVADTNNTTYEPSSWAKADAEWATSVKLILGDKEGKVKWKEPISKEEIASLFHRFAKMIGKA